MLNYVPAQLQVSLPYWPKLATNTIYWH